MYQPFSPVESLLVIHKIAVEGKRMGNYPERQSPLREVDRQGPLAAVRRVAGRGLIALGTRLDPTAGIPAQAAPALRA